NRYSTPYKFYYLVLFVAILLVWFYRNLLRTPTGRSFTAIRDSEISARAMGINLTRTKAMSFFLSATAAGLAGALFG
ncbi:MAG TPA: branched-chain amino acid ABC transporter permease, partial [Rhodobacteraceae bacterium]|nr:branched-chain amino acid ABC transporter permease [Paracoccaceae bacterium]